MREIFLQNVLSKSSLESHGPEPSCGVKLPRGQGPWPARGSPGNGRSPLPGIGVQAQSLDLHCGATLQVFLCGARHQRVRSGQFQSPASLTAKHALEFLKSRNDRQQRTESADRKPTFTRAGAQSSTASGQRHPWALKPHSPPLTLALKAGSAGPFPAVRSSFPTAGDRPGMLGILVTRSPAHDLVFCGKRPTGATVLMMCLHP